MRTLRSRHSILGAFSIAWTLSLAFPGRTVHAAPAADPYANSIADSERWCSISNGPIMGGGRGLESFRSSCDGFDGEVVLRLDTKLTQAFIHVVTRWEPPYRSSKFIALDIPHMLGTPDMTVGDLSGMLGSPTFKAKIDEAIKKAGITTVQGYQGVSFTVDKSAKAYQDYEATKPATPEASHQERLARLKAPFAGAKTDAPLAGDLKCAKGLAMLPDLSDILGGSFGFSPGTKDSGPIAVLASQPYKGQRADFVYTADGLLVSEFPDKTVGERYLTLDGSILGKPTGIYHSFENRDPGSDSVGDGYTAPSIETPPQPLERLKDKQIRLHKSDLVLGGHPAIEALHAAIIQATRNIRYRFDADPRFSSKTNLSLISAALDNCMAVPALMKMGQNGLSELELFENHVFREHRDIRPDKTKQEGAKAGAPVSKDVKALDGKIAQ